MHSLRNLNGLDTPEEVHHFSIFSPSGDNAFHCDSHESQKRKLKTDNAYSLDEVFLNLYLGQL